VNIQRSFSDNGAAGTLYLVATPIGNLEDITYRAIRVLREADIVAAEDTRQTRKLFAHFDIKTRLVAYHEHNKRNSGPELVRLMSEGQTIALVSDAGLPGVSDPGADLAALAVEAGVPVVPVPGASASLSALIASGLPTDRFLFVGFLPRDKKSIARELERLRHAPETLLFYESPHRVAKTLGYLAEFWGGERRICLARELTKRYEEFVRGTIAECRAHLDEHPPLGEYCIVVQGAEPAQALRRDTSGPIEEGADSGAWWVRLSIAEHVNAYLERTGNKKEAMKLAAADLGVSKRDVYSALLAAGNAEGHEEE